MGSSAASPKAGLTIDIVPATAPSANAGFSPATLAVDNGAQVLFRNTDPKHTHQIVINDPDPKNPPQTVTRVLKAFVAGGIGMPDRIACVLAPMTKSGPVQFSCKLHSGETGTLNVKV